MLVAGNSENGTGRAKKKQLGGTALHANDAILPLPPHNATGRTGRGASLAKRLRGAPPRLVTVSAQGSEHVAPGKLRALSGA